MKRDALFEVLEPPPGGLTRLRARMAASSPLRWWPVGAVAAGVMVVLLVALPRGPKVDLVSGSRDWFEAGAPAVLGLEGTRVVQVPTSRDDVVMAQVVSTP